MTSPDVVPVRAGSPPNHGMMIPVSRCLTLPPSMIPNLSIVPRTERGPRVQQGAKGARVFTTLKQSLCFEESGISCPDTPCHIPLAPTAPTAPSSHFHLCYVPRSYPTQTQFTGTPSTAEGSALHYITLHYITLHYITLHLHGSQVFILGPRVVPPMVTRASGDMFTLPYLYRALCV